MCAACFGGGARGREAMWVRARVVEGERKRGDSRAIRKERSAPYIPTCSTVHAMPRVVVCLV